MRSKFAAASLVLLLCATPALPDTQGNQAPALLAASLGTTARVHQSGNALLTSQPGAQDLALARERGIRTVISLRLAGEPAAFDGRAAAMRLGLAYHNVPWNGSAEQADGVFDEVRRLLNATAEPLLLHCGSGNRVGAVWIPWRVLDRGVPLEAAVAEARTIGLVSPEFEAQARDYVRRRQEMR